MERSDMDCMIIGLEQHGDEIRLVWAENKSQLEYARDIRAAMVRGDFQEAQRLTAISRKVQSAQQARRK
jgi:hypothetical protein